MRATEGVAKTCAGIISFDPQRNLLYTGVTRGKRLVVLVGQKKAVAIAVRNVSGRRRWSKLQEWLRPGPPRRGRSAWRVEPRWQWISLQDPWARHWLWDEPAWTLLSSQIRRPMALEPACSWSTFSVA